MDSQASGGSASYLVAAKNIGNNQRSLTVHDSDMLVCECSQSLTDTDRWLTGLTPLRPLFYFATCVTSVPILGKLIEIFYHSAQHLFSML